MKMNPKITAWLRGVGAGIRSYFNVAEDLLPQQIGEESIRNGVSFKGSQLLVLIFAIFIASLGLNVDSAAVIIGAMLISPLMGPIIGMGLAIGIEDFTLLKRGFKNIAMAVLGSLAASCIYFLISPQYEGASQLLARTSPSIYDVFIALFGGAAGIVSICCKNKGQVLPGVAIATSLMPPLCTAGYGLATLQANFFFGALYLFFTNMVFILFATWIGVKLMGYKKVVYQDSRRYKRIQVIVYIIVFMTIGVSAFLTVVMIRKNIFYNAATQFVENEMVFPNTQVLNHKEYIKDGRKYIDVTLIGQSLPKDSLQLAMMNKLDSVGLGGTILNIKQGFSLKSVQGEKDTDLDKVYNMMQEELVLKQSQVDSLKSLLAEGKDMTDETRKLMPDIKALFPGIQDFAMTRIISESAQSGKLDTLNVVLVKSPRGLNVGDRGKLVRFVSARTGDGDVWLKVNPEGYPWPKK